MTHELVGRRIRMTVTKEVYPTGIFRAGLTGTIAIVDQYIIAVEMDEHRDELDEWDNELHWYIDDLEPGQVLVDEFLKQVELI